MGHFLVGNKAARVESIKGQIADVLASGLLSPPAAAQLRGRLGFAEGQVFGRQALVALHELGAWASQPSRRNRISAELAAALRWLQRHVVEAAPRRVPFRVRGPPVLVFTDGAYEEEVATCGAVLITADVVRYFGEVIPPPLVTEWRSSGAKQIIGQAEMLPVLLSLLAWGPFLEDKKVVFFIDNDSAKDAPVKGSSPSLHSRNLLWRAAAAGAQLKHYPWYTRVPSASNIADGPSRLDFGLVLQLFPEAVRDHPMIPDSMASSWSERGAAE